MLGGRVQEDMHRSQIIVDTARRSGNQYVYNQKTSRLKIVESFARRHDIADDFGFIPGTRAER
jgi:hypothetical protein